MPGVCYGLNNAVRASRRTTRQHSEAVVMVTPIYPPFMHVVPFNGMELITVRSSGF